jgi:hypothetical protein
MTAADISSQSLDMAFQLATSNRFCPPDAVLFTAEPDQRLTTHIQNCPACRERLEMDLEPWKAVLKVMGRDALSGSEAAPEPGQIWTLNSALEGWNLEDQYVNTPFVLLLAAPDRDTVSAAQTYWDVSLLAGGDVDLGEAHGFAQPWNTRRLPVQSLSQCWGNIPPRILSQVLQASQKPPETPIPLHPVLQSFRRQETILLATIASRAEHAVIRQKDIESKPSGYALPTTTSAVQQHKTYGGPMDATISPKMYHAAESFSITPEKVHLDMPRIPENRYKTEVLNMEKLYPSARKTMDEAILASITEKDLIRHYTSKSVENVLSFLKPVRYYVK